jgi:predicted transporter
VLNSILRSPQTLLTCDGGRSVYCMKKNDNKAMKVWKNSILPMICLIAFFVYVIFANIYKAKWRGEEPWTKENLLLLGAFFIVSLLAVTAYEIIKRKLKNGKNK